MIGYGLKKWSAELGLTLEDGYAHGQIDGYHITLEEGPGTKLLSIAGPFHLQAFQDAIQEFLSHADSSLKLKKFTIDSSCLLLVFPDLLGVPSGMKVLLPQVLALLHRLDCPGEQACALCGGRFTNGDNCRARLLNGVASVHEACFHEYHESFRQRFEAHADRTNWGVLGALAGAILAMLLWLAVEYAGFYSTWASVLMVMAAWKGYELTRGRPGKIKLITISVVTALFVALSVLLGQYLSACVFSTKYYDLWPTVPQAIELIRANLSGSAGYVQYCIRSLLGGYIFAAVVLVYLGQNVMREKTFSPEDVHLLS